MTARFPELTAALPAALDGTSAIIDTEIVAYDVETGRPRPFKELQSRPKKAPTQEQLESGELAPVCLLAFDLLQLDGVSLMAEPLRRRRELLRERLTPVPGVLAFAEGVEVATANATHPTLRSADGALSLLEAAIEGSLGDARRRVRLPPSPSPSTSPRLATDLSKRSPLSIVRPPCPLAILKYDATVPSITWASGSKEIMRTPPAPFQ